MRGAIGMLTIDFPTAYASDSEDYLAKGLAMRDEYRHHPLLSFCFAPHAPYTVSDKALTSILTYAEQLDLPIHIHLHETEAEISLDFFYAKIFLTSSEAIWNRKSWSRTQSFFRYFIHTYMHNLANANT